MSLPHPGQDVTVRSRAMTSWIALLARLLLGGVLGVAAVLKLDDSPAEQVRAVRAYQLLPHGLDAVVGYTLPVAELLLAIALVLGIGTRLAAVLSGILMIAFIAGVASAWARGLTIDCGCFGGGGEVAADETAYPQEILRDVGLLAVAAFLAYVGPGRYALSTRFRRRSDADPDADDDATDDDATEDGASATGEVSTASEAASAEEDGAPSDTGRPEDRSRDTGEEDGVTPANGGSEPTETTERV